MIRPDPDQGTATKLIITDIIYGLAALTLLGSGIMRVLYFGQGSEFYTQNPLFWGRLSLSRRRCPVAVSHDHLHPLGHSAAQRRSPQRECRMPAVLAG